MYKILLKFALLFCLNTAFHAGQGQDSIQFVGRVWYIQNTNEFYTTVEFKDSVDILSAREELLLNADSTITKEYFLTRKEISDSVASKYFDLSIYKDITVFNQSHEKVSLTHFERVEYYEDMIDGMFIAVLRPEQLAEEYKNELVFYGIGKGLEPKLIEKFNHEEITKKSLDKNIQQYIKYNKDGLLKSKHVELKESPVNKVSILSIEDLENFTFASYLLEHEGATIRTLKALNEDYVFWDLLPIPYLIKNKPVFIVEIIIPESDFTGYRLAIFNGDEYQLFEKMEVKM